MNHVQTIRSDIPESMTLAEYKRTLNRPKRHSAIRRFVSFGRVR